MNSFVGWAQPSFSVPAVEKIRQGCTKNSSKDKKTEIIQQVPFWKIRSFLQFFKKIQF
jgi:hypothetical protein